MLHQLSERITLFLLDLKLIEEETVEIYAYGMEILISSVTGILLAIGVGIIFQETLRVCLFLVSFIPIRSYAGGYHAGNHWKCISLFGVVSLISIYLSRALEGRIIFLIFITVISTLVLLLFSPHENVNRSLEAEEKELFKRKSRKIVLAMWGIIIFGLFLGPVGYILSAGISAGIVISGISLYVAIILERRNRHETAENY